MNYTSKAVYEYISKQTNDLIVEWKICEVSGKEFAVYQSDLDFYDKVSPTFDGRKFQIPIPRLCPEERMRRRLAFRNELHFYKRKCNASNELIISQYQDDEELLVYKNTIRREGKRQTVQQGNPFSGKTVMETIGQLMKYTPKPHMSVTLDLENSVYANNSSQLKNCYIVACANNCEDCYYTMQPWNSNNCIDCTYIYGCEQCYWCVDSYYCKNSSFLQNCKRVTNSSYCENCERCDYCYDCTNLVDKQFCINNKQYTKDEYYELLKDYVRTEKENTINPALWSMECEQSFGNYIERCKDCHWTYDIHDSENCRYINSGNKFFNCRDISYFGLNLSWSYESCIVGINSSNLLFCLDCYENVSHAIYCYQCHNVSNCFGCVGLRNAEYCIFNKQYGKEEYEKIIAQIIEKMIEEGTRGEFFDPSLSLFGYNQSVAMDVFPEAKKSAIEQGYNWFIEDVQHVHQDATTIKPNNFSDKEWNKLREDDTIMNKIIVCEQSGKPFRIIRKELEFYRKHGIDLPKKHFSVRLQDRLSTRPGKSLYINECNKTGEKIISVYPSNNGNKIYSEEAYTKEFYS